MRFAANISLLFTELPMVQRPAAAAAAGFDAVEAWWPFDTPEPPEHDVDRFVTAVQDAGVRLVGLNFDAGDMAGGDRGLVSLPAERDRFRANVDVAVDIGGRLGTVVFNALYGNRTGEDQDAEQDELARENLAHAARKASAIGATVVVEAVNAFENPRYPLTRTEHALSVIDEVASSSGERLGYLYDIYHMQRMEGNVIGTIRSLAERITHVQVADAPDRHEPGTGELAYERILPALAQAGYPGWVAFEYKPSRPTAETLSWLQPFRELLEREDRT